MLAGVAGVLGNQITKDSAWSWSAFTAVLVFGALVTGWAAHRAAASDGSAEQGNGTTHIGDVSVGNVSAGDHGQAAGISYGTMSQAHPKEDS